MKGILTWNEKGQTNSLPLLGFAHLATPKTLLLGDDYLKADEFYEQASEGAGFLWQGDFQNAKQILQAVQRRIEKAANKKKEEGLSPKDKFLRHRQSQVHKAQLLSRLFVEVSSDFSINLPRAPEVKQALTEVLGPQRQNFLLSLRELLGFIGAHEWRSKGVQIEYLNSKIFPHYGVFAPIRSEYLNLLIKAPLPNLAQTALDVGTGTGVLAAILVRRGLKQVTATECEERAIVCAQENFKHLGIENKIRLEHTEGLPEGHFDLIVCNPPWLPIRPTSSLERGIYDLDHSMLRSVLEQARTRLNPQGELWILISDLAVHLGLREPDQLEKWFAESQYEVLGRADTRPHHQKSSDQRDPLFFARSKELTTLWRLRHRPT